MTAGSGSVVSVWRYPVKSMMGEELGKARVGPGGVAGDRMYALIDRATGNVASAKNPAKWARLMECRAELRETGSMRPLTALITLPDGSTVTSDQSDVDQVLSRFLGREVTLASTAPETPRQEEYSPDLDELPERDVLTEESLPEGTFFDVAAIHLLSTATLDRLQELYPRGKLDVRRFRPNLVVAPPVDEKGFVENDWTGYVVRIGTDVRLAVTAPCPRCVMTTLPQAGLPRDSGILRTTARFNELNAGVYASVTAAGTIRRGDAFILGDPRETDRPGT